MNDKLETYSILEQFGDKATLSLQDIDAFYRQKEPSIPQTTVRWRIYSLEQQGIIKRIGRGKYRLGRAHYFVPDVSKKMKRIRQSISNKFPFVTYCLWELSPVNAFAQHLINFNVLFVDVERDAVESVYYALKETRSKVMLVQNLYDNLSEFESTVIVRPLITDSPIQKKEGTYVTTLEKMLVDLCTDKEFVSFQGNEIHHIFENAFDAYTINEQTMLRYAGRKSRRAEVENLLKTINRK